MWYWVLMVLLMGSLLAQEGVSSTCCVSYNASVYILDTLSYGSMACHYGEDVERSSKSHLQTLLLLVLQLLPHCHPSFQYSKSRTDEYPSVCMPEKCLYHIPLQYHRPALSLPRALELFFYDVLENLVI